MIFIKLPFHFFLLPKPNRWLASFSKPYAAFACIFPSSKRSGMTGNQSEKSLVAEETFRHDLPCATIPSLGKKHVDGSIESHKILTKQTAEIPSAFIMPRTENVFKSWLTNNVVYIGGVAKKTRTVYLLIQLDFLQLGLMKL